MFAMNTEKPEAHHELTPQQLVDKAEVERRLTPLSPWLVETTGDANTASAETSPARKITAADIQQREAIQEHLAKRSPWLK